MTRQEPPSGNLPPGYEALEETVSICPACRTRVPATIAVRGGSVYVVKQCPAHGAQVELMEKNAAYYRGRSQFTKPGTRSKTQTAVSKGCPFDCGLCPEHDQHSCIGLIEINGRCELACPACYTGQQTVTDLSLEDADRMMAFLQEAEAGQGEILQISGGEPTLHPQVLDILRAAKAHGFKYVLLNTNGLRIARDEAFVHELAALLPQFEVYLQFDGFAERTQSTLRGRDLRAEKEEAVRRLTEAGIPVTLVATIQRGVNDDEVGSILRYGMKTPGVRGVNYQPLAFYGETNPAERLNRVTLTDILEQIEAQTGAEYRLSDFVPLPCNVERVALTYCYRDGGRFIPITRKLDVRDFLPAINNTLAFDADEYLSKYAGAAGGCKCLGGFLERLTPLIPHDYGRRTLGEKVDHFNRNLFRISVSSFVDVYNFDIKSVQRECVHVVTRDLRRIPFSAYNMFYRTP